jgi:arginyl-tRNA synthetase
VNSLFEKAKKEKVRTAKSFVHLVSVEEKKLILKIAEAKSVIQKSVQQYNPSVIARYTFELAQLFNDFYNKHSVLSAEGVELVGERLALSGAVKQVLTNMLSVLNIKTVEEM